MYIDVILPLALPQLFTYSVPPEFERGIVPGVRVAVQVGRKKIYSAIVYKIHKTTPQSDYSIKDIISVLDNVPVVN